MDYKTFANSQEHTDMKNKYWNNPDTRQQYNIHKIINGHAFFPTTAWPIHIQTALIDNPITDKNTFQLLLFFFGNGCSPQLTFELIYASHPTNTKINKRFFQLKWIANNLENKKNIWYYFENRFLYLNKSLYTPNNTSSTLPTV